MATDISEKKLTTLYREGRRGARVRRGKSAAARLYRRQLADAVFGAAARTHVVEQVASGVPLAEAAADVRVSVVQVHGRARWDPEFRRLLDDALDAYSAPFKSDKCGTSTGYRNRCRCRDCRAAHLADTNRYR